MVRRQRQQGAGRPRPAGAEQSGNCRKAANDPGTTNPGDTLAKECYAGGTSQIYLNVAGRDPAAGNTPQIPAANYETVRNQIVAAFQNLDDPNLPGQQQVVLKVMKKEELRNVDGTDGLHPNRSGDVVVVFRPPYQTDAQTPGQLVAPSQFFGQHGYLPDLVNLQRNINMHATFIAAGRGIKADKVPVTGVRAIDVAPTLAYLLDIPGPQNARGKILYRILDNGSSLIEATILDISDYHGQLVPLAEASDNLSGGGAANPRSRPAGRRSSSRGSTCTGGSEGRPLHRDRRRCGRGDPAHLGVLRRHPDHRADEPDGLQARGLGNHSFDRGEAYLRNTLIPLADFK